MGLAQQGSGDILFFAWRRNYTIEKNHHFCAALCCRFYCCDSRIRDRTGARRFTIQRSRHAGGLGRFNGSLR